MANVQYYLRFRERARTPVGGLRQYRHSNVACGSLSDQIGACIVPRLLVRSSDMS
jgi:hypothetical protein